MPKNAQLQRLECGDTESPTSKAHADANLLAAELEDAYCTSSRDKLAAFLSKWHDSLPPRDVGENNDPFERELYSVFQGFFKPSELNTVTGGEGYADVSEMYRPMAYVIVRDSVRAKVGERPERIVTDFRPHVAFDKAEILYLTPTYREALIAFLVADNTSG